MVSIRLNTTSARVNDFKKTSKSLLVVVWKWIEPFLLRLASIEQSPKAFRRAAPLAASPLGKFAMAGVSVILLRLILAVDNPRGVIDSREVSKCP